jgi:hypothetical protein
MSSRTQEGKILRKNNKFLEKSVSFWNMGCLYNRRTKVLG